jgi:hypothetical protein
VSSGPNASSVSLDSIRENIENIDNPRVQRILLAAVDNAQGDFERAKKNIEEWYDSGMDRVSGWYKRATQWTILVIGLAIAVGLNINAITIVDYLSRKRHRPGGDRCARWYSDRPADASGLRHRDRNAEVFESANWMVGRLGSAKACRRAGRWRSLE